MTNPHLKIYTALMISNDPIYDVYNAKEYLYEIRILGEISSARSEWFAELGFKSSMNSSGIPTTTLKGLIVDQAHLRGLLNKIWDLNFEVILVRRLDNIEDVGG
jgi:hypothetical protein